MSESIRRSSESNGALWRPLEQSPAGPIRLLLALLLFLGASAFSPSRRLAAQTTADSTAWRHVMAVQVAQFLHHEAPHGGLTIQSGDSTDSRDWSMGLLLEVSHLYDSLKRATPPGDSVTGGIVTLGPLIGFEQPYGGIPRQLLRLQFTETTCIAAPSGARYLSGVTYDVRAFSRGVSLYADINYAEPAEGMCS